MLDEKFNFLARWLADLDDREHISPEEEETTEGGKGLKWWRGVGQEFDVWFNLVEFYRLIHT